MGNRKSRAGIQVERVVAAAWARGDGSEARAALLACMKATRRVRAGRDPMTGAQNYKAEADMPMRLAAATTVLQWTVGLPKRTLSPR
jgi:hypothetical protein